MAVQIINGIMAVFFVIGALDYLLDNKLGLGSEFERGFGCAEKLFITMGGFVALAPVIARVLSPAGRRSLAVCGHLFRRGRGRLSAGAAVGG